MSEILPFDFEGSAVRVLDCEGNEWFVAGDVCAILGTNTSNVRRILDRDEVHTVHLNPGKKGRTSLIVSESGLYHLIFKSRKPAAKRFRKWVTSEVLPAIRKTGKYEVDSDVEDLDEDVAPRMTIPQYLKTKPTLTFEGICAFGALVRRSNQALGCSYKKECHPRLGRIRSYTTDILDFAWSRFLRENSAVRLPQLPGLEGLEIDESTVPDAA